MPISLETILDPGILRKVWRDIQDRERKVHLIQAPLVRDSTGGAAFDLSLTEVLTYLRRRVLDGTYRPHPPLVMESAKSKLLRLRRSFLSLEDALILGALVQSARPSLMEKMPEWVRYGRIDESGRQTKKKKIITLDYEGWWIRWLRHRNLLKVIEGDLNPLLVISDIANFFGSVDLLLLRSKVTAVTSLDNQTNDLLFYLLEHVRPAESYGPRGSFGLPIVPDDTSHILAHFYLGELDRELLQEGRQERYTRWVDDIMVSVRDAIEGGKVVTKIQRALSRIGLVANSSKTTIISKNEFRRQHYEEHNEYLDIVHDTTEQGVKLCPADRKKFELKLSEFLGSERQEHWNRILRRYYTESRRIRSTTLLRVWDKHLKESPTDAPYILDYAAFFQGTLDFCEKLFGCLQTAGSLFEDVQVLAYETLLLKPFPNDPIIRSYIVHLAYQHFLGKNGFERPNGYVRGLQALTIYKFGGERAVRILAPHFEVQAVNSPDFAAYAFPVVAASGEHRQRAFEGVTHIEDSRILRIRALIERLENGDDRATGILLGLLEPKTTRLPVRGVVNPRGLPLLSIALRSRSDANRKRVKDKMASIARKMQNTGEPELVDWITIAHLQGM